MNWLLLLSSVSLAFGLPLETPQKFTDYKLLTARIISKEVSQATEELEGQGFVDVWSHGTPHNGSLMFSVAPEHFDKVKDVFAEQGVPLNVVHDDIQKLIDEDQMEPRLFSINGVSSRPFNFNQFETYEQINASLNYYANEKKTLPRINVFTVGKSVEQRDIVGIQISNSVENKKIIFMECGIHAREWASVSTCLYIIDQLISNSTRHKDLLDRYEFHIIPSSNPDGYVYSHTSSRLWRKNRSKQNYGCYGVDLNRNFKAGTHCGVGTSKDPCSEIFCGSAPFSEPETAALNNYISQIKNRVDYYISLHAFGLMWMFPYSYSSRFSRDHKELLARAKVGVDAIKAETGTIYRYGNIADTIYAVTGSSIDWVYDNQKIKKAYILELQPSQAKAWGGRGFLLPAKDILFVGKETFLGLKAMWLSDF